MIISPEHAQLKEKYQQLLLKNMQLEKMLEKRDEDFRDVTSKVTALQKYVDSLSEKYNELHTAYGEAIKIIEKKDKQIEELLLIKHQHEQLKKLVFGSKSEKSVYVSPDQLKLALAAETIDA